jgi:hypothetical protein
MLFARVLVNEDDTYEVLEWPLSETELRARFGHTILPKTISAEVLAGTDYVRVPASINTETFPQATKTHRVALGTITFDGIGWNRSWKLEEVTDLDEAAERVERKWAETRKKRDELMAANDWRVLRNEREVRLGVTVTEDVSVIDADQQKLANITNNYDDPFLIDWDNLVG